MNGSHGPIVLLLCQIAVILAASRVMGLFAARLRQPQVVGEMAAGIMLGPSLLGLLVPGAFDRPGDPGWLFPAASIASLNVLAQVGVVFFLFLIGLELDPKLIRNRGRAAIAISHASIVAPFALGVALTFYLFDRHFEPGTRFVPVALFMGAAMSVTAFPVLARILTERNLHKTQVGAIAITCAAVDDVTAWCLLAFVVAVAQSGGSVASAVLTLALSLAYIAVMLLAVRPFLARLQGVFDRQGRLGQDVVAVILLMVLASSLVTEWIGIHALFGAFMLGAVMPKGTRFVRTLAEKLEDFTVVFMLPVFFAYTGLKTQIGLLNAWPLWVDAGLIVFVACLGKFGGSAAAAVACGLPVRDAAAIGVLMNTRGLMELVILNIGRDLGVISNSVFAMMVIMALVTTALTTPVLAWVYPRRLFATRDPAGATPADAVTRAPDAQTKPPAAAPFAVLIPVAFPRSGGPLVQLANLIAGPAGAPRRIVALHLRRPVDREAYRTGLDDSIAPADQESLEPLLARAAGEGIAVEPVTFTSVDVAGDIAQAAGDRAADLVLMGFHNPVFGKALLGGTVAAVMRGTPADVGVFIDRGFDAAPRRVLVPFLGTSHDRLALDLAGRIGRAARAEVTVLHVVAPDRAPAASPAGARAAVTRAFADPTQPLPVTFRTVTSDHPVTAVLDAAGDFDLVVIGVAETWGLESQLFGLRPERIARDSTASLLIVRKYQPAETGS